LFLESLKLYRFRNFDSLESFFSPGVNFLTGRNGQGKTNLIEAVNLLASARSFRTSSLGELISWGSDSCSVFAQVRQEDSSFELGMSVDQGKKEFFINQNRITSFAQMLGKLLCVVFTPFDLELVKGAPSVRRRFFDRHMSELKPALYGNLLNYSRALKNKSRLLMEKNCSPGRLESWNLILAENGAEILRGRQEFIRKLEEESGAIHGMFAPDDGTLEIQLRSDLFTGGAEAESRALYTLLEKQAHREIHNRSCLIGPHRDDVIMKMNGQNCRFFSSQGQARSLALSLKLGVVGLIEKARNESPVVLLDDVASELDRKRKESLYSAILRAGRQVFITGTEVDEELIGQSSGYKVFEIKGGSLARASHL